MTLHRTKDTQVNIQQNKKKQEIKRDPLVEFLLKARNWLKANNSAALGAVSVIVLLFVGYTFYNSVKRNQLRKAQETFGRAMIAYSNGSIDEAVETFALVTDNHGNSPQAAYSAFLLGNIYLKQGRADQALSWFETARGKASASHFVSASALEAIATCYERTGEYEKALTYFKQALENDQLAFRAPAIRWKMALINKQLSNADIAREYCEEIVADTSAATYQQKARNMLVELAVAKGS
ncbi:MAG: tetratricopeptide repeat protein [Chitinivibrionales bacterium]|nr:tetratricopeptide repeat protein [Chitinivibrionales bacterium]